MGSRIHRDVNEVVKGEGRFVQAFSPFQRQPTLDVNLTERVVLHRGDVGMHELACYDEVKKRMR
jgi:hypothetical protein